MPYSISGTTITVSGTVDLTNVSLPPIYRIVFGGGGADVTFSSWPFFAVPPMGTTYSVVGSTAQDVLRITMIDHGAPAPNGPPVLSEPSIDLSFFTFANWSASDLIVLTGNSDNNSIAGTYRSEVINGGAGRDFLGSGTSNEQRHPDTLRGGNGDDSYGVHPVDIVDETGSDGIDTIRSYWSYSLLNPNVRGDVENLTLTAVNVDTSATGNALSNKLVGGLANNTLNGMSGDDVMQGRAGNDIYYVDSLNDTVDETLAGSNGVDTIRSYLSYTLLDTVHVKGAVENLALFGVATDAEGNGGNNAITGNGLANIIKGLGGNDVLNGAGGSDELNGAAGNDTYALGSEASGVDKVVDSSGADTVSSAINRNLQFGDYSEIENLLLLGNAVFGYGNGLPNLLTGNAKANQLFGLAGNDRFMGGVGADRLTGGPGGDQFIFSNAHDSSNAAGRDFILDFTRAQGDKIVLSAIDASTKAAGNQAFSFIGSAGFSKKAGQLHYRQAGSDTFIEGDINGDGVADLVIISNVQMNFVRNDFVL